MIASLLALLMLLGGGQHRGEPAPGSPALRGTCDQEAADKLIGKPGTEALAKEAQKLTKAQSVRWMRPGQPVTMDYSPGRLNIDLDFNGIVAGFSCG